MKTLMILLSLIVMTSVHAGECTPNEAFRMGVSFGSLNNQHQGLKTTPLAGLPADYADMLKSVGTNSNPQKFCMTFRNFYQDINKYNAIVSVTFKKMREFIEENGTSEDISTFNQRMNGINISFKYMFDRNEFKAKFPLLSNINRTCMQIWSLDQSKMNSILDEFSKNVLPLYRRTKVADASFTGLMRKISENRLNNCQ